MIHTARWSLVAPETMNIMMKVIMISTTNDCMIEPDGLVPKKAFGFMSIINTTVPLARVAPKICDPI